MPALDDDINASLPTIAEEDDSIRSGSTTASKEAGNNNSDNGAAAATREGEKIEEERKEEKRRGKKDKKKRLKEQYAEDHDTAQQILVDLCNEMKELKTSLQEDQEKTTTTMMGNLESNQLVMKSLSEQLEAMQGNMKQLDQVIESKATPEQIEELARIRAVQEMISVVTEDKEQILERLRQDLESERKEVAALRTELEIVREERHKLLAKSPSPRVSVGGLEAYMADDSSSQGGGSRKGPGGMYLNGGSLSRVDVRKMSDFDDMTLETKGSYDTTTYEMKSLKKRIIHMKKKLAVAQQEVKETADLRAEVEKLRIACETEKKASLNKDETINRLKKEIEDLRRGQVGAVATATVSSSPAVPRTQTHAQVPRRKSPPAQYQTSAQSVTVTSQSKKKWWQNI
ncbi:hypothetical protein QTG54_003756 [Skeletonema marinoi]|uniref:Uncharacterized protein n=1 Tax=Skeletonema marinoi TaxID=267567 RepID=A0AAD8YGS2_9STRA|nr:hypothetical protein QTG54_003756 [Skeletonema marinoi]